MNTKRFAVALLVALPLALASYALGHTGSPSPTTFVDGDTLTAAQLNNTIAHVHNTFSGGIVDTHLAANAAVQHTKLAAPALVPKAWAMTAAVCGASPCTLSASSGVSSITRTGTGLYTVTWTTPRANASYLVMVQAAIPASTLGSCRATSVGTTTTTVRCQWTSDTQAPTDEDAALHVLLLDDDT